MMRQFSKYGAIIVIGVGIAWLSGCSREKDPVSSDPPAPQDLEWVKTAGPNAGAVLCLAFDSAGSLFAGTDSGVYKSPDKGQNWAPFTAGLPGNAVYALSVDANDRVYAGLDGSGLFRTPAGSDNWVNVGPVNRSVWTIALNAAGHIFAATSGGLYRSTDQAATWTPANNGLGDSLVLSLAFGTSGEIYAGGSLKGVFRSTDNGDSWSQTGLPIGVILTLAVDGEGRIFAGTLGAGLYYSTNLATTWSWALPANGFHPTVVYDVAANSDNFLFACGHGDGVYRSTTHGVNWEEKNANLTSKIVRCLALDRDERLFAGSDSGFVYYTFNPTINPTGSYPPLFPLPGGD
ncbi:MAG: hypothetical protein HUU32_06145 [Calditrichaceae bacterium]|nr:hypothetical protein [Calditrichia bacterium]NUQ40958.1 hypothetical protein [Calditrichaceae bacterium]